MMNFLKIGRSDRKAGRNTIGARPVSRSRHIPRPRWLIAVIVLVSFCCLLVANGFASSEIGVDARVERIVGSDLVPDSITNGGPMIDGTRDPVQSYAMPPMTIVLSFDDGPDPRWTPAVLEVLRKHHVPGTFFVVGSMAAQHPELIRQLRDSGAEIGIHTFTHPDLGIISHSRFEHEISETQLAIAGAAGITSYLIRPPYSSTPDAVDNAGMRTITQAGDLGYMTILSDVDSKDWQRPGVPSIVRHSTPEDGAGGIVLLHDAGGDRSQTVAALDRLIPQLKQQGYRFSTVADAMGRMPANQPATTAEHLRGMVLVGSLGVATNAVDVLEWLLIATGVLVVVRLLLMLVVAHRHARQRKSPNWSWGPPVTEPVSVIVPAYNEKECIADTVRSLAASDHPVEILVVDDGSTDNTADIAESLQLPNVKVIRKPNGGKPSALNTGIMHARHNLIVMIDGDTVFEPTTVRRLVQPFADPTVGAVAGNAKVANRKGLIARWQHIEYVIGFNVDRRVYDVLRCMPTVPGAVGAFRREVLLQVGGVSEDTLAEDTDLTMAVCRTGSRVVYEETARAWTEAPATLPQLWRQRYRWSYGTMQSMWKHRRAIRERGASGRFGRWGLLHLALFQVMFPLFAPLIDVFLVYGLVFLDPLRTVLLWSTVMVLQLAAGVYAFHLDGERKRALWLYPLQQIVYRQVMYAVLIRSIITALSGIRLKWQKLQRTGGLEALLATESAAAKPAADVMRTGTAVATPVPAPIRQTPPVVGSGPDPRHDSVSHRI
jgi:cellulose synthase/poly-beta-1,6-N-acetylglucosamine synthase-like glycosyltransferase/peptidoglycan/xylan/chitin deacetylase (PgdA/CDA1 family)